MANKYSYSRTIRTSDGEETFSVTEMASFDEAKREVDKGIRDRRLELQREFEAKKNAVPVIPPSTGGPMKAPQTFGPSPSGGE